MKVNVPPGLQHFTNNQDVVEVNGSTVGECLNQLTDQFPGLIDELFDKDRTVLYFIDIYINGETSYPEELTKPVKDGDELTILLLLGGG